MQLYDSHVELPARRRDPLRTIAARLAFALGLVVVVALVAYIGRDGYVDADDERVSLLDAFYYATVTITTTGYGDVRPVGDGARLATIVVITPARVLFLILLVGTTLEVLTERTRHAYRLSRWRKTLKDHVIICGFGTKGRAAAATLLAHGYRSGQVVVVDESPSARSKATSMGLGAVAGSATTQHALIDAGVAEAAAGVVAVDRDVGAGLDIVQRPVTEAEVGPLEDVRSRNPVVAVARGGRLLRFDDPDAARLEAGDALVEVVSRRERRDACPLAPPPPP